VQTGGVGVCHQGQGHQAGLELLMDSRAGAKRGSKQRPGVAAQPRWVTRLAHRDKQKGRRWGKGQCRADSGRRGSSRFLWGCGMMHGLAGRV
jgi:hypothetical protein